MTASISRDGTDAALADTLLAAAETKIANLEIALKSARTIGMAIGILMALRKLPETEAFDLLRQRSQASNRKLREVAEDVVRLGTLE